jgi:DNA-binding SARP family transcriptional activator
MTQQALLRRDDRRAPGQHAQVGTGQRVLRLRALLALLALLALTAGLPTLLGLAAGNPIPTHLPSGQGLVEDLSRQDDGTIVAWLLIHVAWLAWAVFATCVLVEAGSLVRNRPAPRLYGLAGFQRTASHLVATAMLLTGGVASQLAAVTAHVPLTALPATDVHGLVESKMDSSQVTPASYDGVAHIQPAELRLYVVRPPHHGRHDTLWGIAEAHLGDPLRWREIVALNRNKPQPDGRALVDPHWIQPGWQLLMPADATGLQLANGHGSTSKLQPHPTLGTGARPHVRTPSPGTDHHSSSPATDLNKQARAQDDELVATLLAGGGLLAAGALFALARLRRAQQRRRPTGHRLPRPPQDQVRAEVALRVASEPIGTELLDRALRGLEASLTGAGMQAPPVAAARITDKFLELWLEQPSVDAPSPWQAMAGGRRWQMPMTFMQELGDVDSLSAYPGLISVGTDSDGVVLLNLCRTGAITIVGPEQQVRCLLTWIAAEVAVAPWSDAPHLTLVGFGEPLVGIDPERLTAVESLDEHALRELERRGVADPQSSEVITQERGTCQSGMPPEVILCAMPLDPDTERRLINAAKEASAPAFTLIAPQGALPSSRRIDVDAAGTLRIPDLGIVANVNQLPSSAAATLASLFRSARHVTSFHAPDSTVAAATSPIAAVVPADSAGTVASDDVLIAAAQGLLDPACRTPKVCVLGPVEVHAHGPMTSNRLSVSTEIAVYLALHPRGVTTSDLDTIWEQSPVPAKSRMEALTRVRRWFGSDDKGIAYLPPARGSRLQLQGVLVDWLIFEALARRGMSSGATGSEDLRLALRLVRGLPFEVIPENRFAWLAELFIEQEMTSLIVDAAHVLAQQLLLSDDTDGAYEAGRQGRLANRYDERPWGDMIEAELARGRTETANDLIHQMRHVIEGEEDDELSDHAHGLISRVAAATRHRA